MDELAKRFGLMVVAATLGAAVIVGGLAMVDEPDRATAVGAGSTLELQVTGATGVGRSLGTTSHQTASLSASAGWLETVNYYRSSSGLAEVSAEPAWIDGQVKHLAYLANTPSAFRVGEYANAHTENPASPWYTPEGDKAGRSSNIGGGRSEREAIEGWMTAPFHSIGVMRPGLTRAAFAMSSSGSAMLDVISGLTYPPPTDSPSTVLFPGSGSVTSLTSFAGELPDPREGCAQDWRSFVGLPMYAMLPAPPPPGTTAQLTRPDGTVVSAGNDLCVQTAASFNSSDTVYGATGKSILAGGNVVLVMSREPLSRGPNSVVIQRPGESDVSWSFSVKPPPTPGSVGAGSTLALQVGGEAGVPSNADAVALNVTVVNAQAAGFATVYPCGQPRPEASNLNYAVGQTIPNLVIAKPGVLGWVCVYSDAAIDVLADVSGFFPAGSGFTPIANPTRVLDTRNGIGAPVAAVGAGSTLELQVTGVNGVTSDADAVVLNMTVVNAQAAGFATVYPCGQPRPEASNMNYETAQTVPNLVIAKPGGGGKVCIYSYATIDVLADVSGFFPAGSGFTPISNPTRVLDTRNGIAAPVRAGTTLELQVTGVAGVPANADAVVLNMTVVNAQAAGFATVYPCGQPRPEASNLNYVGGQTIPNLVIAKPGAGGKVCIYSYATIDVLADVSGFFPAGSGFTPISNPIRVLDTRSGIGT